MNELAAVRCASCGGTVKVVAGQRLPSCLFCGAAAADLIPTAAPEGIEPPVGAIPFAVDEGQARAAFLKFAGSSYWYPSDLRQAKLELRRLLLPAWTWSGTIETHWTGLVAASTRSGRRPESGSETVSIDQVLVPASKTLRLQELAALAPYDEQALAPFDAESSAVPIELSELTRSASRARAHAEMCNRRQAAIQHAQSLVTIRASSLVSGLDGRPVLIPVWIGAFRYGERPYRILVNGQTGRLVGNGPFSWWKLARVVAMVLLGIGAIVGAISLCLGGGSAVAALLAFLGLS